MIIFYSDFLILHKSRLKINEMKNIQNGRFWRESNASYPVVSGYDPLNHRDRDRSTP